MSEKLSEAQRRVLRILGSRADDLMVGYGSGFGVNRSSVRALADKGLAYYLPEDRRHVSCRITPAGREALKEADNG